MIAALFLNPGFLFIAATLVSVPIIIHLINRMRFKRVRWAAMEFLLKAQKRTRRRLIIEQLLLLALRCLLIALVGLLVSRFIGCGDTNMGGKPNLHLVLLDDTVSMQDAWSQGDGRKTAFDIAKSDILTKKIAKGLSLSKTNDRLILLPLSKLSDPGYQQPKPYERLNTKERYDELEKDIAELTPSMLHVNMLQAVKEAEKIIANYPESRVTLHLVGDFRQTDWGLPRGEGLTRELLDLVKKNRDVKVRPIDTVFPFRSASQGGYPAARDNVGIVDIRPGTRIAGKNMPVNFTVSVANFSGKEVEVSLEARDENTGKDMQDINYNPQNPIKLKPSSTTNVTFEKRFGDEVKPGESHFAHLSVRLTNAQKQPLDNDGLTADNLRHTVIEIRDKVPILVIDGEGPRGQEEGKDSFHIENALMSVSGASYHVVYGDKLSGGNPTKALERADLNQFPTIFMLNVRDLTPKQVKSLENYVRDGGGVAFFLGPQVNAAYYNKNLYKDGNGIFPAPLKETYFPPPSDEKGLEPKSPDTFHLLIRDEKFPDPRSVPIFGAMFQEPKHREPLRDLPIKRYFQVQRSAWKQEPGRTYELATLPNDASTQAYQETIVAITRGETVKAILAKPEFAKWHARLQALLKRLEDLVAPGTEFKAYHLANQIEFMLTDQGNAQLKDARPDMTEFWANSEGVVQLLRRELATLREQVNYGDPFVITSKFGKGKVVAVMSTAGKDWNSWGGGSVAALLYAPFILEMQNYLSSQGSEANLTVGTTLDVAVDGGQFKGTQLKIVRYFMKPQTEKPSEKIKLGEQFGKEDGSQVLFSLTKNNTPGLYISELVDESAGEKAPIAVYAHAFNVDTQREGQLQRVGSDELDHELIGKSEGAIKMVAPGAPDDQLIGRINDFSESPWLFLIFLLILVAEQALAVHLSFHLKGQDDLAPVIRQAA